MPMFATLCYLRNRDKVLLLHKARGLFGEGKWNALEGKLRLGENPSNGPAREIFEETGLRVSRLKFNGILNFYLGGQKNLIRRSSPSHVTYSRVRLVAVWRGNSGGFPSVKSLMMICGKMVDYGFHYYSTEEASSETSTSQTNIRNS